MKITVKKLQGGECNLEVLPTTCISEIKHQIAEQLGIPVEEQKLLIQGRTLADDQTVESYPTIKDGAKLNLIVKKPEGLYEVSIKFFKKSCGMSDTEAINAAAKLLKVLEEKIYKMSWDDIDRLALDCLLEEQGEKRPTATNDAECDDTYSL